jgi:hypothetical protein
MPMHAYNGKLKTVFQGHPAMGGSAQISASSVPLVRGGSGLVPLRRWAAIARIAALALALLLMTVLACPAGAHALKSRSWLLKDQAGRSWSLTLLEQADPAYPGGLRLRITDRTGTQPLDHQRPLRLSDGLNGAWQLANSSQELVPAGSDTLPQGSAQFDLAGLEPRPRAELPLLLEVPLASGGAAELLAGPDPVVALHDAA